MTNRYLTKVVSLDGLIEVVREHRTAGRTLVHCHGCFDIIHPGHLRYLQFSRRQGDVLLVSLTGDAAIDKSAQHPYIPQELRAENLAALEMVDLVYVDPNPTAADLLGVVRPDVFVKGKEYESADDARFREERRIVEDGGGTVIFSSGDIVYSSTRLLESLGQSHQLKSQRLEWVRHRYDIHADSLATLIADMQGKKAVVVGDLIVDRYVYCDARNVASESPMLSLTELGTERFLGGVGVVAGHLAALGADPFVLTQCGADERSEWAVQQLQRGNIDAHLLRGAEGVAQKSRYLVDETKIVKVDEAVVSPLDSVAQRTAAAVLLEAARGADAVIFCDFGFGMLGGNWLEKVLPELRRSVSVIGADVSGTRGNLLRFRDV
ncbi:MAG: adenylyltransferase/cytidyltransferase family protein, partial [Gammaproteobacteria bacterium]|nr:adenylyltransferase/cytidyltransferase family protein [Gammaproteobacteria bacterium]